MLREIARPDLSDVVRYCRERIANWDLLSEKAVRDIGRKMPIDAGLRWQIEECVEEWCEENGFALDFFDDMAEDIVLWAE